MRSVLVFVSLTNQDSFFFWHHVMSTLSLHKVRAMVKLRRVDSWFGDAFFTPNNQTVKLLLVVVHLVIIFGQFEEV